MALDFPQGVANGTTWEDDCGNVWVYDDTDDKWTIRPPAFDFPEVDDSAIWARAQDDDGNFYITPLREGDDLRMNPPDLDMGAQNADIDLVNFPEKT